ncbi:hypothetical protein [Georgenia sp. AZ-5]|uniref:type IV toxin-antitoxin system AbiEi family antitoxin domain-containing protein n=1 Tax=Georgenia sp. AZ-5 TaxID=3367526 RepID=UPI0037548A36
MHDPTPRPPDIPETFLARDLGVGGARHGVRSGALIKVRRGGYIRSHGVEQSWRRHEIEALGRCVVLGQQLRCEYVFSHVTAALIHGCWIWRPDRWTHLTQPVKPSTIRSADVRRHVGAVDPEDVTVVHGLPVTSLERTIEDCAMSMHPRDALVVVDSAIRILTRPDRRQRRSSDARIEQVRSALLARLERRRGQRGIVKARAVVTHADPYGNRRPKRCCGGSPSRVDCRGQSPRVPSPRRAASTSPT